VCIGLKIDIRWMYLVIVRVCVVIVVLILYDKIRD